MGFRIGVTASGSTFRHRPPLSRTSVLRALRTVRSSMAPQTGYYASYPWPWTQIMKLSSTAWQSGSASCVARLYSINVHVDDHYHDDAASPRTMKEIGPPSSSISTLVSQSKAPSRSGPSVNLGHSLIQLPTCLYARTNCFGSVISLTQAESFPALRDTAAVAAIIAPFIEAFARLACQRRLAFRVATVAPAAPPTTLAPAST